MKTEITAEFLKPYFTNKKKHKAYAKTVEIMNRLKCHANGEHPSYQQVDTNDPNMANDKTMSNIITEKRPNESDATKDYRIKIFVPITKSVVSKIFSSLMKIRKSADWAVKYDPKKESKLLQEGECLDDYCEKNYPFFGSITNWAFNVLIKHYGIDPNGVVAIIPLEMPVEDGTFLRPFAFCFDSNQIFDYQQDDYAILYSTDKSEYSIGGNEKKSDGKIFWVITTQEYQKWEQADSKGTMTQTLTYPHGLDELPVFKMGGIFYKSMDRIFIWESRLDAIVPRLTEAAREYTDLQAEVTLHTHSEKWMWATQKCLECDGNGARTIKGKGSVICDKCHGSGKTGTSPYEHIMIRPGMPGESTAPIPPAGYISKSTDIVKIQNERIQDHLYQALSAINMEWLVQVPQNQSGKAKEVDRDELNNFVSGIAEDLVNKMDRVYYFTNELRNKIRIKNRVDRLAQLPSINVPDKFDLVSVETSIDMLIKARQTSLSPILIANLEIEYATKQFSADPYVKEKLELYFRLDPLPGLSDDAKQLRLANKGITQLDYVISSNMEQFLERAILENPGDESENKNSFFDMDFDAQFKIISGYAQDKIKENSAKEAVMTTIKGKLQPDGSTLMPDGSIKMKDGTIVPPKKAVA